MSFYEAGSVVWVKLSQHWWPGSVKDIEDCPTEYVKDLKKEPLAIVKFFNEPGFHHVTKQEQIFSYNCNKKVDFINKGLGVMKSSEYFEKFEADIATAEKLTGGNVNIVEDLKKSKTTNKNRKKVNYNKIGFGEHKVPTIKNVPEIEDTHQRYGFTDIKEAILYKRDAELEEKVVDYIVKVLEQPPEKEEIITTSTFKCHICGFTCTRIGVIVWHNKAHLKKVYDYDTGIRSTKKKRKPRTLKLKAAKKPKLSAAHNQHAHTNGHVSPRKDGAKQLLEDWDDDEDIKSEKDMVNGNGEEITETNGIEKESDMETDDGYDDDDNYPRPPPKKERQPMPKQVDINFAFDALLADSSPLNTNSNSNSLTTYANNDSDSDASGWDKYMNSDTESEEEEQESDIKSICEKGEEQNGHEESSLDTDLQTKEDQSCEETKAAAPNSPKSSTANKAEEDIPEDNSSQSCSSSSSTSSGPAYMLVAVDAHGNNVPMPVLSEGGNHLVAVEASMEDGTTRTLYIDPAHLGPNVDLNNLMLHIDNSGQETVIIPTSNEEGESSVSSSVVDQQAAQDFSSTTTQSSIENERKLQILGEDSPAKRKSKDGEGGSSLEMRVSKMKKSLKTNKDKVSESKTSDQESNKQSVEGDSSDVEWEVFGTELQIDDILWSLTHGNWWPSFVVNTHPTEKKMSILYINCQQNTPMKVGASRIKKFSHTEFQDIFIKQRDKAVGLTDAMEMAIGFSILFEAKLLTDSPKIFFSLPTSEQRSIINKLNLIKQTMSSLEEKPLDILVKAAAAGASPSKSSPESDAKAKARQEKEAAIRERRNEYERYVYFMRSLPCLDHLRNISKERSSSARHNNFMFFSHQLHYWNDMNKRHNPAAEFLGPDLKYHAEVILFLESQVQDRDLPFPYDAEKRKYYIQLVLFPEAVKESLRKLTSFEEKKFEGVLAKDIYLTNREYKKRQQE